MLPSTPKANRGRSHTESPKKKQRKVDEDEDKSKPSTSKDVEGAVSKAGSSKEFYSLPSTPKTPKVERISKRSEAEKKEKTDVNGANAEIQVRERKRRESVTSKDGSKTGEKTVAPSTPKQKRIEKVSKKDEEKKEGQPVKKRRGRPPKNAVSSTPKIPKEKEHKIIKKGVTWKDSEDFDDHDTRKTRKAKNVEKNAKKEIRENKYPKSSKQEDQSRLRIMKAKKRSKFEGKRDDEDKFAYEKEHHLHYPGRVYTLSKEHNKKGRKQPTRVRDILLAAGETEELWDERAEAMIDAGKEFEIDFVIGSTDPKVPWTCETLKCKLLIKYKEFPRAEWLDYSYEDTAPQPAIREFVNVQRVYDKVAEHMERECAARGKQFEKVYPSRYLLKPKKDEQWATNDLAVLRTLQMARQHDLNEINEQDGAPPLYIADWMGKMHDFETNSINAFEFTNFPVISRRVIKALEKGHIEHMDEHCGQECTCANPEQDKRCTCEFKKSKYARRHECSTDCRCDVDICSNRVVQRGRQQPLIIMRHPVKGWTIRAYTAAKEGDFLHEYVGELVTYQENKSLDQTYALDQSDSLFNLSMEANRQDKHKHRRYNKGKKEAGYCHRALVVNGIKFANEARFNSHGCRPKLRTVVTYVDRASYGLHRTAFYADKDLEIGEEITWNYHGEELAAALDNRKSFSSSLLPKCDCGDVDCPISKNKKTYVADVDKFETEYDSFPDSDEEEEQREEARKKKDRGTRLENRERNVAKPSTSAKENVKPLVQ